MPSVTPQQRPPTSLCAKLFAGLAAMVLLVAFVSEVNPFHYLSFASVSNLLHATLWAHRQSGRFLLITGFYGRLCLAMACAALALGYFGVERFARRPPNRTLSLLSFVMVAVGIVVKIMWSSFTARHPVPQSNVGLFLVYAAAFNCFDWGVYLSLLILAWSSLRAVVTRWRARPESKASLPSPSA